MSEPDLLAQVFEAWEDEYVQIAHLGDQGAEVTYRHFQKLLEAVARRARQQADVHWADGRALDGYRALREFADVLQGICPTCGEVDDRDGKHNSGCPECRARHPGPGPGRFDDDEKAAIADEAIDPPMIGLA